MMQPFSLLMSVYEKENPAYLKEAFQSVLSSSIQPSQFVLIKDGPLTQELEVVIAQYRDDFSDFIEYGFPENQGLGVALKKGIELCRYPLIARFDSDDICMPERFRWQLERFLENPNLTILGGHIQEFSGEELHQQRFVPLTYEDIKISSKKRNPFNHMTVMFKKDAILACGNYRDVKGFEDYDLWLRVLHQGYEVENLDRVLVNARAGLDMIKRRRGWSYLGRTYKAYRGFYQDGLISRVVFVKEMTRRGVFSLIPRQVQHFLYQKLLRK